MKKGERHSRGKEGIGGRGVFCVPGGRWGEPDVQEADNEKQDERWSKIIKQLHKTHAKQQRKDAKTTEKSRKYKEIQNRQWGKNIEAGRESHVAFGYSTFHTNLTLRSYSINHNPAIPSQLCPEAIIHLQNKTRKASVNVSTEFVL